MYAIKKIEKSEMLRRGSVNVMTLLVTKDTSTEGEAKFYIAETVVALLNLSINITTYIGLYIIDLNAYFHFNMFYLYAIK